MNHIWSSPEEVPVGERTINRADDGTISVVGIVVGERSYIPGTHYVEVKSFREDFLEDTPPQIGPKDEDLVWRASIMIVGKSDDVYRVDGSSEISEPMTYEDAVKKGQEYVLFIIGQRRLQTSRMKLN